MNQDTGKNIKSPDDVNRNPTINLNCDMRTVITDIKEKIKKINAEEQQKMPTLKIIPMEDIILDQINSSDKTKQAHEYTTLLRRQQQLTLRKQHLISPMALEGRARQLFGANNEETMVNDDINEMLARSQVERYYKVSDSQNLFNDISIDAFQKPWGKLDTNLKINRLMKYAEKLQVDYSLDESSFKRLRIILIDAVNNRKLTRKTDIQYNEEQGQIMAIKGLIFDEKLKIFNYDASLKKPVNIREKDAGTEAEIKEITSLNKDQIDVFTKKTKILVSIKPKVK